MMDINITKIVQDRIDDLAERGVIENAIGETFEKTIVKAVTDSLESWELKKTIQSKMTEEVSKVVADLDFQSYNGFMVEKMSRIIKEQCREDICQKAESKFKEIFLCQTKEIKLSTIFQEFRKIACEQVDEAEKYERMDEGWHCKCEEDSKYKWLDCELDYEERTHRYTRDNKISFTVHRDLKDNKIGRIYSVCLDGHNIKENLKFGSMNDVELMLIQAVMNEIPIIIDIDDTDDIDNTFDVDY